MKKQGRAPKKVHGNNPAPVRLAALAGFIPRKADQRAMTFNTDYDREEVIRTVFYLGSETAAAEAHGTSRQLVTKWMHDPRNQQMVERINREAWQKIGPRADALLSGTLVSLQEDLAEGRIEPRDKIYMVQVLSQAAQTWANKAKDDTFQKMGNLSPDSMIDLHKRQIAVLEEIQRRKNSAIDAEVVSAGLPETSRALPDVEDRRAPGPLSAVDPETFGRVIDRDLVREGVSDVLPGVGGTHQGSKDPWIPGEPDL